MASRKPAKRKADQARLAAVRVLYQVLEEEAFSNESAAYHLADPDLDARDRAFASALIFGTLGRLPAIDYFLGRVSKRPLKDLDPWVRTVLRAGVWQLFYSYQVTVPAACDESVRLIRFLAGEKATGFVNGILRKLAREKPKLTDPALVAGLPRPLFKLLSDWYGREEALEIGRASLLSPSLISIRPNGLRMEDFDRWSRTGEAEELELQKRDWPSPAYGLLPSGRSVTLTEGYRQGLYSLQSRAAMMVGCLAPAGPGDRILDLCAAPGGKTGHLAEKAGPDSLITACDVSPDRLAVLEEAMERLGHDFVRTRLQDALVPVEDWEEAFDLVLCDVPCSGLGLMQKRPEIRLRVSSESIGRLTGIQADILKNAGRYVRPGGSLLYTTCTINPQENEDQVKAFLETDAGASFALEDLSVEADKELGDALPLPLSERLPGSLLFLPHRDQSDGFYIARLRKTGPNLTAL